VDKNKSVIIWRVDVIYLGESDWKYEKSSAGERGGGRTHTFGLCSAAKKLRDNHVFFRDGIVIKNGKPIPVNGN
jgi:hypothetical protein